MKCVAISRFGERLPLRAALKSRQFLRGGGMLEDLEGRVLFSTYLVTSLADGIGAVTPASGGNFNATTLRSAIVAANARAGADVIQFATSLKGKIDIKTALPKITSVLKIAGPGAGKLTLQRSASTAANFSVMHISPAGNATLSGLQLSGGTGDRVDGAAMGGGLFNEGTLTLASCTISNNSAKPADLSSDVTGMGFGGGIYSSGALVATDCTFTGNIAYTADGGAIYSNDQLTLTRCTFTGNSVTTGHAGAIRAEGTLPAVLSQCTITNNNAQGYGGGGIYANCPLTLSYCTISNNQSTGVYGISTLTISHSTISGNTGGGIVSGSSANISDSTISNNKDQSDGGGGIYSVAPMVLTRCVISGNSATQHAGAIYSEDHLTLVSCTVSNNTAGGHGGAIYSVGTLDVSGSTFAGNTAGYGGAIIGFDRMSLINSTLYGNSAGDGGAVSYYGSSLQVTQCTVTANSSAIGAAISLFGPMTIANSIVAGNIRFTGTTATPSDINITKDGSVDRESYANLVGVVTGVSTLGNGKFGNKVGVTVAQLKLGPLADNGGLTQTVALLPGSIAINAGQNAQCLAADGTPLKTDQRGVGYGRMIKGQVDIGAFEVQPAGSVGGLVFIDANGNGVKDKTEKGIQGHRVWADLNRDGIMNAGEPQAITDATGQYTLEGVPAGRCVVRLEAKAGTHVTKPGTGANEVSVSSDLLSSGWTFGVAMG